MADGRLAKDVQFLRRHIGAQTNGQAKVTDVDDNLEFISLDILPSDGYYKGAKLRFKLRFNDSYPEEVPQVLCLDDVYHPNIEALEDPDSEGMESDASNVCVSLLNEWDSNMSLDHIVMAILFVLYNPAPDDALSPYFDSETSMEDIEENIRKTLRGEMVEGKVWPCLMVEGEETQHDEVKVNESESAVAADNDSESTESFTNATKTNKDGTMEKSENLVIENTERLRDCTIEGTSTDMPSSSVDAVDSVNGSEHSNIQDLSSTTSGSSNSIVPNPSTQETSVLIDNNISRPMTHDGCLADRGVQGPKHSPVIILDSDYGNKTSDKYCADGLEFCQLFCSSRMKTLFSCFHRGCGMGQLQVTKNLGDGGDYDVD